MSAMKLPPKHHKILHRIVVLLPKAGRLYLVGGTVRDLLLERVTHDLDVVVTGVAQTTLRKRLEKLGTVHLVGARFGVLKLFPKGADFHIDIALPRKEVAGGTGGYKDFSFKPSAKLSIEDDVSRRDFTVNAMALAWPSQRLVDPFGGQKDLTKKQLRAVGKPETRFGEDYSRLLRLLRFSVQLDFSIERKTAKAAKKLMPRLNAKRDGEFIVPREVIAEQLIRSFEANAAAAFDAFDRFGAFSVLAPEIHAMKGVTQSREYHSEGDVFFHTRFLLEKLPKPFSLNVVFAALLHDVGKPKTRRVTMKHGKRAIRFLEHTTVSTKMAAAICERLKLSSYNGLVNTERVVFLVKHHHLSDPAVAKAMKPATLAKYFSGEQGKELLQLIWADQAASLGKNGKPNMAAYTFLHRRLTKLFGKGRMEMPKPLATGTDIMRWMKLNEGPAVGGYIRSLQEAQLMKKVRTKKQARAFLLRHKRR